MTAMASTAYASPGAPTRTPRASEYDAIARITARLKSAAERGDQGFAQLAAALHENRRLWLILASDVAGKENALPPNLRAQILYLAAFTEQHSRKVLANQAAADALIDVNTAVMRGLRGDAGEGA
ncbi:flagellar biosynthesis regulator FlaF [Alkalilacustris brevis]|uniref:flagellar biosynthesis regulator FlaF n=1 Tax=Alkalilacustris brevis TaxID=2026338 RepID=UPI000E0CD138|nr:flagellar biosynthesis regulator FlaF [Alkalilacustris brevis]